MSIPASVTKVDTLAALPATTKQVARDCRIEGSAATRRMTALRAAGLARLVWVPTEAGEAYLKAWEKWAKGDKLQDTSRVKRYADSIERVG